MRSLVVFAALAGCRGKAPEAPPGVAITLAYPDARAEVVEANAVIPLERALAGVRGVRHVEARIDGEGAHVLVEPAQPLDVQQALATVRWPAEVPPPRLDRARRGEAPIATLVLRGERQTITEVSAYGRAEARRLEVLPGVARVEMRGLAEPALIVWPDPDRLTAYGLALTDVVEVLRDTEAGEPDVLADAVVKAPVRLGDVARLERGFEREPGEPTLAVYAQLDADRADVERRVRDALAKHAPPGLTVTDAPRPPSTTLVGTLRGDSLEELQRIGADIARQIGSEAVLDPPPAQPETVIVPDRERAARLGVAIGDIAATIAAVGRARVGGVVVKLPAAPLAETVAKLHVRDRAGALVPMSSLVTVQVMTSPAILRVDRRRAVRISVRGAADAARRIVRAYALPPGYEVE